MSIRPLEPAHVPAVVTLLRAALPAERIDEAKFCRQVLLDPEFDPRGAVVAESPDGAVAGFAYAVARRQPRDEADARRGFITVLAVDAAARRTGVGRGLLDAGEAHLRALGRTQAWVSPYGYGYFTPGLDEDAYPAAASLFRRSGYTAAGRPISMRVELSGVGEPAHVAAFRRSLVDAGISVVPFAPEFTQGTLDLARGEFDDDWERTYRDAILELLPGAVKRGIVLAIDRHGRSGPAVVGISHFNADRFGPIGVAKVARHRGVGQVLAWDTLMAQRSAGFVSAYFLWSDAETARRLYDGLGFVVARRFTVLRKAL